MIAIAFGTINVVGGFLVTDRMLEMFKRKPEPRREERARPGRDRRRPSCRTGLHRSCYIVAFALFIYGLNGSPARAPRGAAT